MKTTQTAVRDQKLEVSHHTPGPWTNRQSDHERAAGHIWVTQDGQGHVPLIARVSEGNPQAEANARLIAAAPELLAALEKICSREMTAWNGQVKGVLFEDICAARTAIAKATGN